jgi:hypothetical protein
VSQGIELLYREWSATRWRRWCLPAVCVVLWLALLVTAVLGQPVRRMPLVRYVGFSQHPKVVQQGQTATYTVKVRFQLTATSLPLQASVVYYDASNNQYTGESDTLTLQIDTNYYHRIRVVVPIPAGYSYVNGSLRYDGQTITPSSVSSRAVYCWVEVRADGQDHSIAATIQKN